MGYRRTTEVILALTLALAAMAVGMGFLASPSGNHAPTLPPAFATSAVMVADGRGFLFPAPGANPLLTEFVDGRIDSLRLEDLPDDLPMWDHESFRETHRYLLYTLGYVWRIFGVNWGAAKLMLTTFLAVSVVLVYAGLRLFLGRTLSAAGALAFALAPPVLTALPLLRDFSKTPWILGMLLILGYMLARNITGRRLLFCAGLLGLVVGVGFGFRQDLLIGPPIALLTILFFVRGEGPISVRRRLAAAALFIVAFYLPARPIFTATDRAGSLFFHNIINGFGTPHEDYMGLDDRSYEYVYNVNDNFSHAVRTTYVRRALGDDRLIYNEGPDASWAGKRYVTAVAAQFPADLLTRGLGTIRFLVGRAAGVTTVFADEHSVFLERQKRLFAPLARHLGHFGVFYAAASLLIISARDARLAWALLIGLFYFCGYPVLQLQVRHCFHLILFGFGFFLFFWTRLAHAAAQMWNAGKRAALLEKLRAPEKSVVPIVRRVAWFAVPVLALMLVPLYTARIYQHVAVGHMLDQYYEAKLTPLEFERLPNQEPWATDWTIVRPEPLPQPVIDMPSRWEWRCQEYYVVLEFQGDVGGEEFRVRYATENASNDFSDSLRLGPASGAPDGITRYFLPVYTFPASEWLGVSRFDGVVLPPRLAEQLRGVCRVTNLEDFPLLLNLTLPADPDSFVRCRNL